MIDRIKAGLFRVRDVVASTEPRGNLESVGSVTAEVYSHIDDECPECGVRENFIQGGLESYRSIEPSALNRFNKKLARVGECFSICRRFLRRIDHQHLSWNLA